MYLQLVGSFLSPLVCLSELCVLIKTQSISLSRYLYEKHCLPLHLFWESPSRPTNWIALPNMVSVATWIDSVDSITELLCWYRLQGMRWNGARGVVSCWCVMLGAGWAVIFLYSVFYHFICSVKFFKINKPCSSHHFFRKWRTRRWDMKYQSCLEP